MLSIESGDFTRGFAIGSAFFQIGALVASHFALTNADLGFEFSVLPIKFQHNERAPFDLAFTVKFVDLFAMKQKFAHSFGGWNFVARFFVRLNIGVEEERFPVFDPGEGVADVRFARANRFYFAALELNARFVAVQNMKIAERLAIKDRLGGHDRALNALAG